MESLTLLQTVLMAMNFFLSLTFNSLPLNCNGALAEFQQVSLTFRGNFYID